jgi:glycosyltransferase involved in cell wall biosynthesis
MMRDNGKQFLKNIENKIKGIVCLTDFHSKIMKEIYDTKIPLYKIGHGVININNNIKKVKHRFIYTSYPNRGLDLLLAIFPAIREEFPDAELHIYRDESTFSKIQNEVIEMCGEYVKKKGYVSNERLLEAFQEAEVWLYPTNYAETFCMSALEAQAAGCLCITSAFASLKEVVGDRGVLIEGEYGSKDFIEKILRVVRIFFNSDLYNNKIKRAKEWATLQTWKKVSDEWRKILN